MLTSDVVLEVRNLEVRYGHVTAVSDISLKVSESEMVALLGANGAGKSTLLRAVSGQLSPHAGSVVFRGEDITGVPARKTARMGISHVPEGRQVVAPLTVEDNLRLAARASHRRNSGTEIRSGLEEVYDMFPGLYERQNQPSGLLSGGEQQMLALGRGIMARPEILLLDEPSMGLAPIIIEEIFQFLQNRTGTLAKTAILLAEQTAALALSMAKRAYVLTQGRVTYEGPAEGLDEEAAATSYLGGRASDAAGDGKSIGNEG